MLIRFRPDVIALKPEVVVILAGTNDIAGNTGPMTLEMIEDNFRSMVELAKANNIKVVMSSVMPVCDYIRPQTERRPPAQIIALNEWLKDYCREEQPRLSRLLLRHAGRSKNAQKRNYLRRPASQRSRLRDHGAPSRKSSIRRPPQPLRSSNVFLLCELRAFA